MRTALATFESIYRELRDPVARLCLGITGDRAAAEDAVQETFLSVHRGLPFFRGESRVSTWVYRIALRAALATRGRGSKEAADGATAVALPLPALEARDELRQVAEAMRRLPAEQRIVLSLFALDGLGHGDIAELLGLPEGTIWWRLHAARMRLREELKLE